MKLRYCIYVLMLITVSCSHNVPEQIKERLTGDSIQERIIPVGVLYIDTMSNVVRTTYAGTLQEGHSMELSFKYGGTLQYLYVKEGTQVRKGQMLAKVNSSTAMSTYRSANATLAQAKDAYARLKKVYENGSLPEIKWQEMLANVEKAQASADMAQAMLNDNVLRAPYSGYIAEINVEKGQNISPMMPVMKIISKGDMMVKIAIPENEISNVNMNDSAQITIPALGSYVYTGVVAEKGLTADFVSHTYTVKVLLDSQNVNMVPGMIGKVTLQSDVKTGIIIPGNAILLGNNGKFVWIVKRGKATRSYIETAGYSGTGVVVSSGLRPGDHVIVEGYQKVSENMKVKEYDK